MKIFDLPIKVGAESIDVMRHVNNKEYLRWMESAALEHSAALGWTTARYFKTGFAWVARSHWIEYLRPTFEHDELVMHTWVEDMEGSRSLRRYALLRDHKVCMRGATQWAFVNLASGRATDVLPEIAESFTPVLPDDPDLLTLGIRIINKAHEFS